MGFLSALDRSIEPLVFGLDVRSRRQAAIAANIANADTPGYRGVDVSFDAALRKAGLALTTTDPKHLRGARLGPVDRVVFSGGTERRDGNDVSLDAEMVKVARNQIEYQFLAQRLGDRFRKLKDAIAGRSSP